MPDSLELGIRVNVDATKGRVAWWSDPASAVVVADLANGRVAPIHKSADVVLPVGWGSDGSLFAVTARGGAANREVVLVKIPPGSPTLVPVTNLPAEGCWLSAHSYRGAGIAIGGGGRVVACTVRVYRPDVWLADAGGKSGW